MLRSDFSFELPPELIAQYPVEPRTASRLLVLDGQSGACHDSIFQALPEWLSPGDLLVFNDTRVIPARLYGRKASGGKVEVLVERLLDSGQVLAHLRASKPPAAGSDLHLNGAGLATVLDREGELFRLRFAADRPVLELLQQYGQVPLPPYITRPAGDADVERYQTVYARHPGAVAAPTAGLHFDQDLLADLRAKGIEQAFITLHVGAGTFQPVRLTGSPNTPCTPSASRSVRQCVNRSAPPGGGADGWWPWAPPPCAVWNPPAGRGKFSPCMEKPGFLSIQATGSNAWMRW